MSFEDLMKMKERLGDKVYNETVFGQHKNRKKSSTTKQDFKRENKNRPREVSAKRPVPFLGNAKLTAQKAELRDPRFDAKCGDYDANKFRENFSFVSEIREKELVELKEKLKTTADVKEIKRIKYLIQRMENQNTEQRKRKIRLEIANEEKDKIKKAKKELHIPHYTTQKELKAKELVQQFLDLKSSGQLNKHLEKRRKKNTTRDRKKFTFD